MLSAEFVVGLVVILMTTIEVVQTLRKKSSPMKALLSYLWELVSFEEEGGSRKTFFLEGDAKP